ncbi:MAG: SIMPL domain-containing protein [Bacteroidota bacterium]
MKTGAVIAVLSSMLALSAQAADGEHTVSVTGKAEVKVKPDAAYITLYARADGILMVDAVKKADKLVDEITTSIKTETNTVKGVAVVDVALGEKKTEVWRSDQKEEAPRPEVIRRIRITCKPDPARIYETIDKGLRAGALMQIPSHTSYSDDIRGVVVYGLERSSEVLERMRKAAMDDAKSEADKSATLAGKKAGGVVTIGCWGSTRWNIPTRVMGMQTDFPTEYIGTNPEEITISHAVAVTFALKE